MKSDMDEKEIPEISGSETPNSSGLERADENFSRKPMNNISRPYMRDDLFKELMTHYQNADWEASLDAIDRLSKLYPGESSLDDFREDILMRSELYKKGSQSQKVETRLRIQQTSGWLIIGIISIVVLFFVGRWGINQYQDQRESNQMMVEATNQAISLQTKYDNAEDFLQADRPEEAMRLYEEIENQSPGYADVETKKIEAQELIDINELYDQGLQYYENNELDAASQILTTINEKRPNYKDVPQLLENILKLQQIAQIKLDALDAFRGNDWKSVIDGIQEILSLDPSADITDLEEELFISYMNIIVETADRPDSTIEDIEQAESYYRAALALFPQSREYADEREELEKVATNLIVNKFHIYALELIETERYSINSLEQGLRALQKASSINPDSPAINSDISAIQGYITAFNHYSQRNYDDAIIEFEDLLRTEPNFATGRINYMLYESHMARGDIFLTYGDFGSALDEFETAETYAWDENAGMLQLFQVEVKIGMALRKLSLYLESSEYFHFAASLINLEEYLDPDQVEVVQAFNEAQVAYLRGQSWEASRLYDFVYQEVNLVYPYDTVRISRGDSLVDISYLFKSTIDSIRELNSLGDAMEARIDQELLLPNFEEDNS